MFLSGHYQMSKNFKSRRVYLWRLKLAVDQHLCALRHRWRLAALALRKPIIPVANVLFNDRNRLVCEIVINNDSNYLNVFPHR